MMGGDILAGDLSSERLIALATETGRLAEYLGEHLDATAPARPGNPEQPLLAALAGGVERGEIERVQAIGIGIVMFGAGGESTAALIGSVVRRLAEDEGTTERLRDEPHLISRFIEEVARLEPPFKFHYRLVGRGCELGGAELSPGDRLMLLWASANRDPAHFDDPDSLRLDRRHPKQHMSFGRGGHFCVGAPLARLEARIVVEHLLSHTKRVAPRPNERPLYTRSIFVRRLERLGIDAEAS
jgi:cytochrome P450